MTTCQLWRRILELRISTMAFLIAWLRLSNVKLDAGFINASRWAQRYSPVGQPENGEVILEFAKEQYKLLSDMLSDLDKKADDLMKTVLAVFAAVLTLISTRLVQVSSPWTFVAMLGLVCHVIGLSIAAMTRIPTEFVTPMSPRKMMKISDLAILPSRSQMESVAASSYHVAITGARILNRWKSNRLMIANGFFLTGVALVGLSLMLNYGFSQPRQDGLGIKFELKLGTRSTCESKSHLSFPRRSEISAPCDELVGLNALNAEPLGCTCAVPIRPPGTGACPTGLLVDDCEVLEDWVVPEAGGIA
jgi:hypothetical protein